MNSPELITEVTSLIADGSPLTIAQWELAVANDLDVDNYYEAEDDDEHRYHSDGLSFCPISELYYTSDDDFETYFDRRGNRGSAHRYSLLGGVFFFCERSGNWYNINRYTSVHVEDLGETWCYEENNDELTYCDANDCYYYDTDNMPDDEDDDGIPSYHSQARRWNVPDGITLGVELEVYVEDAQFAYNERDERIIGERDGSLDDRHGVEFIGQPMNYGHYLTTDSPWHATLKGIREAGGLATQPDGYGIHISVGRQSISSETQARFILFINACQEFSEFIAEREQNRWAEYNKKNPTEVCAIMAQTSGSWGDKYSATNVTYERIEVRIFHSTINPSKFQKNLDYVMSAIEYAESTLVVEDMLSISSYLAWLSTTEGYLDLKDFIGTKGSEFALHDKRRIELATNGFIISTTTDQPTI